MNTLSNICTGVALALFAAGLTAQEHTHEPGDDHAHAPANDDFSGHGNDWFDKSRLDLGIYYKEEAAVGVFNFSNPRDEEHQLSKLMPSCSCSKAIVRLDGRTYEVGANKVLYRVDQNEDGTDARVRVEHINVEPGHQGEIEVHMTMAGIKGRKEASLGIQTTDEELPVINLSWRATGATLFTVSPPDVNLNEMSWADQREFQFTVTSPHFDDFNIVGHEPLPEGMAISYSKEMSDDGKAVWTVKGTYGPGANERDNGGLIQLKTDVDDKVATARVIAFLKGPLTLKPGGFIGLGHIRRDEGKEVEITITPTGDFDLQVEDLTLERFKLPPEQQKFVNLKHHKNGKDVVVVISIDKGMDPTYLSGLLKIHLNHPSVKTKEVMFNGFVR